MKKKSAKTAKLASKKLQKESNIVRTIYPPGITGDELADDILRQFAEAAAKRKKQHYH